MTDRSTLRKAAAALALPLLLAGCGSAQSPTATIDEKVAAAEKAAERAEKAQKATEEALRAMAGAGGAQVSYDEAVEELDKDKDKDENDTSSPFSRQTDNRQLGSGETRVNSDGVEELATPPG